MTDFKYNRVLLAFIALGLMASLVIGWQRHQIEENTKQVEMVIDYEDVVELAQVEGVPVPALMAKLKTAGITSLALTETSLEKLQKTGRLAVVPGSDLLARYRTGELDKPLFTDRGGAINPDFIYIFGSRGEPEGERIFAEVAADLERRLGSGRVHKLAAADGRLAMAADVNYEKAFKWNLGLLTADMKLIAENGFYIVARPSNYTKVQAADIDAVFARLAPFAGKVTGLMFVGEEALGFPGQLPHTAKRLKESGLSLYMIESPVQLQFVRQDGLINLVAATDYRAARVYVIPKDEQPKLRTADAIRRWGVTDQERNIRVNLFRKYDKPEPGENLLETNLRYLSSVRNVLAVKGHTFGPAATYPAYFPATWLLALVVVGTTAAGVLFLTLLRPFPARYQYILLLVLSVLLIFPILKGGGTLVRQAAALVSAVIFPVLAVTWQLDRWRRLSPHAGSTLARIIFDGAGGLVLTTALSLVGGFYLSAVLADIRFLLEIEIFRGVKLTFIAPLILITLTYLVRYNPFETDAAGAETIAGRLTRILDYPVYLKTLLLFGAGAAAAWVFIGRSGHTAGVPVPAFEIKLRAFLEETMYARPREKEFLIGHPAFFLAVMAFWRQWPRLAHYIMVVVATIGQGSLVETFAHMRTPVYMSLIRGLDGLALGLMLGILAVIAMQILHYLSFLLGRRPAVHD